MRNFTESYQEECREVIKDEFKAITAKLPHIWTRIQLKYAKQKMHDNFTDILGRSNKVKQPIFTQNEIAKYEQNKWIYVGVLFLMIFFESILYSMMASLFMSRQALKDMPRIEIVFGLAFAIIFVAALHFAFKSLWEFFEAKFLIERDNLSKIELKPFYKNLVIGILIITVFVITNTYTGFIRATIFEGSGTTSTSLIMQKLHGPLLVFSIAITFIVALVMALLEKEIVEKSEKYKVFKNWKRQQKERKVYNTQVKDMLKKCLDRKNVLIDEYWGVMKDLQRVFEVEVDADREDLYAELNTKIANNEIDLLNIDEVTYQKYLPVAITRHELFEYGIATDKGINETIDDLQAKVAIIKEFEKRNAANGNGTDNSEKPNDINT
ncbi:MAG: hypothetical protein LC105_03910 [Chitinophagales bacterium]|nr:hypothetical protein [Chitinophagales bacterium]